MTSSAIKLADGTIAGIADDATTSLTYTASDASTHHAAVYALDSKQFGIEPSAGEAAGRAAFAAVIDDLTAKARANTVWTPTTLTATAAERRCCPRALVKGWSSKQGAVV